jgi:hypothetical protein
MRVFVGADCALDDVIRSLTWNIDLAESRWS